MKKILIVSVLALLFSSCYTSRVSVGEISYKEPIVKVQTNKNHIFIAGLVPSKGAVASDFVGNNKDYIIKTQHTFADMLLSVITLSIYTPTTTKFYIKAK